jgi:autotransporter-associated beta strand protein
VFANYLRRALFEFDLSSIPAGATITSASLQLYCTHIEEHSPSIQVFRSKVAWGEGDGGGPNTGGKLGAPATAGQASWNNRLAGTPATPWGAPGGLADTDYATPYSAQQSLNDSGQDAPGPWTWNGPGLTADVQYWVDHPTLNFGWFLISDGEGLRESVKRFAAREFAEAGSRPALTVAYSLPSEFTVASGPTPAVLRVLKSGTATSAVGVKNAGTGLGDFTITSPTAVTVTPNGQTNVVANTTVDLAVGWSDAAVPGARTGSFAVHNANIAADADDTVTLTGAVVDKRAVTADPVDFGVQHVGANLGSITRSTTFHANGPDTHWTRVTVNGQVFDADVNPTLSVTGTVNSVAASGTLASYAVTPEGIGDTGYAPVTVGYTTAAFSGNAKWKSSAEASWSTAANWTDTTTGATSNGAPGTFTAFSDTDSAAFDGTGAAAIVDLDTPTSLKSVTFSGARRYTLGGTRHLTLKSNAGAATLTASGTHHITAPMSLASNAVLRVVDAFDSLTIDGPIDGAASLTKDGDGILVLGNADNTYSAGTIVNAGALEIADAGALPAGGPITVGAGARVVLRQGMSMAAAAVNVQGVPEPSALALLGIGTLVLMVLAWRRR